MENKQPGAGFMMPLWVIALLMLVSVVMTNMMNGNDDNKRDYNFDDSKYQAIFLDNGQVYFGKAKQEGELVTLEKIFYLQVQQEPLQQPAEGTAPTTENQNKLSLVKLGEELHGPEDFMHISSDKILFTENLKADGDVSEAIKEYFDKQASGATNTNTNK